MNSKTGARNAISILLKVLVASIGFVISLTIAGAIAPMAQSILEKTPSTGILSLPASLIVDGVVNAVILVWAAQRSPFKGVRLLGALLILLFGAETFQTQIETGYFVSAFPLLQGNFELYRLILRGFISSAIFVVLVALLVGAFSRAPRPETNFTVSAARAVRQSAWLAAVYLALYMLFGYFVAWQSRELRLFYGGPAELNSFISQWTSTLMARPELPVFQYFRGILWILCLVPLFMGFSGGRRELVILSALALGLLPTVGLVFPNPLMPSSVSIYHFWEVSISNAIFGALCAWFVPTQTGGG
jgi:hypothetical protein